MIQKKHIAILIILGLIGWGLWQFEWGHGGGGCAFCNPAILERQMVYRGESGSILLTHKPARDGHLLVIPHRHVERFQDLTVEEMAEMMDLVRKVYPAYGKLFGCDDYFLLQKNGATAGQTVPHVHFHVIPGENAGWSGRIVFLARFLMTQFFKPIDDAALEETRTQMQAVISS